MINIALQTLKTATVALNEHIQIISQQFDVT